MEYPDFSRMDLRELTAWEAAVRLAIAALEQAGGDAAIFADDEGFEGAGHGPGDRVPRERVKVTIAYRGVTPGGSGGMA